MNTILVLVTANILYNSSLKSWNVVVLAILRWLYYHFGIMIATNLNIQRTCCLIWLLSILCIFALLQLIYGSGILCILGIQQTLQTLNFGLLNFKLTAQPFFCKYPLIPFNSNCPIIPELSEVFFLNASNELGHIPSFLYSVSRVLNTIGSKFTNEGIDWIYAVIHQNKSLDLGDLEGNTLYYLENLLRKSIFVRRKEIKEEIKH